MSDEVVQQVEITIKYAGYIERQEFEVEKFKSLEDKTIPDAFDFSTVPSLRLEARQKLAKIRPATIGQAARISGVSPADISILMVWLKRWGAANGQRTLRSRSRLATLAKQNLKNSGGNWLSDMDSNHE